MKVERDKKDLGRFSTIGKSGVVEVRRRSETSFEQELSYSKDQCVKGRMQEIMQEIDKLTEQINRSIAIQDLMRYRKLVKSFLKEASSQAFEVERRRGRIRGGRTVLVTVQTIDQEMEKLIQDFMNQRREPWEILETLDKIRGMMVDLMI